jgi:hypothetical protein
MQRTTSSAALGLLLTIPALALVVSSLLKFSVPLTLIHPAFVLGGLVAALALSVFPVIGGHVRFQNGALLGDLSIRVKGNLANLSVALLSLGLLGLIALYLFVENFRPR